MRKTEWFSLAALLVAPALAWGAPARQQTAQPTQPQNQTRVQSSTSQASPLVEAARKARENQKSTQAPVVFTNDNMPKSGTISVVGSASARDNGVRAQAEAAADAKDDERTWRQKFADARAKLRQDKEKLAMLKSDLNALGLVRYFNETDAVTKQQAVIDEENQINVDEKALDDLQDSLRKAGGDPAWAQ